MTIKKIAVLTSSYEHSCLPTKEWDPAANVARFVPEAEVSYHDIHKATAIQQVTRIAGGGFDLIINLCDGSLDGDTAGVEVVQTLERCNAAFTGASSAFYDPSRVAMKMAATSAGVSIPGYMNAKCLADVSQAVSTLSFPLIVKHPNSYNSIGLTPDSRVTTAEALQREALKMIQAYGGALIEEFIEGREFTVLVAERRNDQELAWALPALEVLFPSGETFKHFDLKWKDYPSLGHSAVHDCELDLELQDAASRTFFALSGTGYARCDFRRSASGEVFLLEINPNCDVFYPEGAYGCADEILAMTPDGHISFLQHLITLAHKRCEAGQTCWVTRFDRKNGFGMFAIAPIRAGSLIKRHEDCNQAIVSRDYVRQQWPSLAQSWFGQYAWPLNQETYAIWSSNPEDWCPINHSCEPTAWLDGLDVVARRDIDPGEQLTLDYATFNNSAMVAFECHCGASTCRGVVSGNDYLLPELQERYEEHFSAFLKHELKGAQLPYKMMETPYGLGLASGKAWREGDTLCKVDWVKQGSQPTRWTIHFAQGLHGEPYPLELRYINHSCNPNVFFDIEHNALRALRPIEPDEPLSFFYPSTEWSMVEAFHCACGQGNCCGRIAGAQYLSDAELARYRLSPLIEHRKLRRFS